MAMFLFRSPLCVLALGLILIGGDGTFKGSMVFDKEFDFPIIGIPGTIDNDINGTNYTLGYDTALNTAVEAIDK